MRRVVRRLDVLTTSRRYLTLRRHRLSCRSVRCVVSRTVVLYTTRTVRGSCTLTLRCTVVITRASSCVVPAAYRRATRSSRRTVLCPTTASSTCCATYTIAAAAWGCGLGTARTVVPSRNVAARTCCGVSRSIIVNIRC